jgi:glycosyltransferase 2 family protein
MKSLHRILAWVRCSAPWIALGAVAFALSPHGPELLGAWRRLPPGYLLASLAVGVGYRPLNAGGWAWVLDALGAPLPFFTALRIWLVSESLRWLPGSIWGFCSRVDSAREAGVTALAAGLSLPVELSVTVASWTVLAAVGLVPSGLAYRLLSAHLSVAAGIGAVYAAGLLGAALLLWRLRRSTPVMRALTKLKAVALLRPNAFLLLKTGLLYAVLNTIHGAGLWILLAGLGYQDRVGFLTAIGANAAGWLAGFFAIGIPGGIGVREGCIALVLSSLMPWQEAAFAALIYRLVSTCAELATLVPCLTIPKLRASWRSDSTTI